MPKIQPHLTLEPTKENIAQCLIQYDISDFNISLPSNGVENTTVFVQTSNYQNYVLRIYKKDTYSTEQIDNEISYIGFLSENDIPVPALIVNNLGNKRTQVTIDSQEWQCILMKKLPGEHTKEYNPTVVRELAYYMASLHRESLRYKKFTSPPETIRESMLDNEDISHIQNGEYKDFLHRIRTYAISPLNLPHAMIHGDLNRSNTLFENDTLTGIIDFEAAHHGYLIEDIASTLYGIIRHVLYKAAPRELIDIFLNTYQIIRPLKEEELIHIPDFILYRCYYLAATDYLLMKSELDLQEALEMEISAIDLYKQWLEHIIEHA